MLGRRSQGLLEHAGIVERAKDHPFQKQELMLKIGNAPAIRYGDLREMVRTAITFGELPFDALTSFVRIDADDSLVALTVLLDNSKLAFEPFAGGLRSTLQIYGLIRTLTRRVVFEFDDDIQAHYERAEVEGVRNRTSGYQRKVILKPGPLQVGPDHPGHGQWPGRNPDRSHPCPCSAGRQAQHQFGRDKQRDRADRGRGQ